jgi:uncharacterized protein (DUF1778 family)
METPESGLRKRSRFFESEERANLRWLLMRSRTNDDYRNRPAFTVVSPHIDTPQNKAYTEVAICHISIPRASPMPTTNSDARINVRLSSDLKQLVEEAAVALGQTVSDFTISTLVREARQVIQDTQFTRLSNRDRDVFLSVLESSDAKPNDALKAAARRYKKRIT